MSSKNKLYTITEISKELDLIDLKGKKTKNHTIRYWEKEFKQIKPKYINKRRYYTLKQLKLIKLIKFLIKNEGLTLKGVKKVINPNLNNLDDYDSDSLKNKYYKELFKKKTEIILEKLKKIKSYGKKNTYKSKIGPRK